MSFIHFSNDKNNTLEKKPLPKYQAEKKYGIAVTNKILDFVGNVGGPFTAPIVLSAKLFLSISTSSSLTDELIETIQGYRENLLSYERMMRVFNFLEKKSNNVISYPIDTENIANAIGNLVSFLYGFITYENQKKLSWKDSFKKMVTRTVVAYTMENVENVITTSMTRIIADMMMISNYMVMQLFALSASNNELFMTLMSGIMEQYNNTEAIPKLDNISAFYNEAQPEIQQAAQEISNEIEEKMVETQKVEDAAENNQSEPLVLPDKLELVEDNRSATSTSGETSVAPQLPPPTTSSSDEPPSPSPSPSPPPSPVASTSDANEEVAPPTPTPPTTSTSDEPPPVTSTSNEPTPPPVTSTSDQPPPPPVMSSSDTNEQVVPPTPTPPPTPVTSISDQPTPPPVTSASDEEVATPTPSPPVTSTSNKPPPLETSTNKNIASDGESSETSTTPITPKPPITVSPQPLENKKIRDNAAPPLVTSGGRRKKTKRRKRKSVRRLRSVATLRRYHK
jgi:hypothetical protein